MPEAAGLLRVALITDHDAQGRHLRELLEREGVAVVVDANIQEFDLQHTEGANVLLVNLDAETSLEIDRLELLIETSSLPILFNEGGVAKHPAWISKLVAKLAGMVSDTPPFPEPVLVEQKAAEQPEALQEVSPPPSAPHLQVVRPQAGDLDMPTIWVLGASLGGPQAVKHFLRALPDGLPFSFIYAQHIGASFVPLLAQQMQRVTDMSVSVASQGQAVRPGEVMVVPVDRRFMLTGRGTVHLSDEPIPGSYRPCIDDVIEQAVNAFGRKCGAIIFSGMGRDGERGCQRMLAAACTVFAQQADSCVISSMPDAARSSGAVSYSATPEMLAERIEEITHALAPI